VSDRERIFAGPYELLSVAGAGGCAVVHRAIHCETGAVAAVKVQRDGPFSLARFHAEIDALQQFDHVHVMPIIEADPERKWYAMPLADATLDDLRRRAPHDWEELRRLLSGICGALLHMHAQSFVHRDVTPKNILCFRISGEPHWVLGDYGLVRRPPGWLGNVRTASGARFGTERFSAPELLHEPRSARAPADAYSVGAVASWFTSISHTQTVETPAGAFWSELIHGTRSYIPEDRWTISEIAAHLERGPRMALVPAQDRSEACPNCGSTTGVDAATRCLRCHQHNPY
jgi:serine/threonine-protein kinase